MITQKTQHVLEAVGYLLCQSKGQPRIEALLTSYIEQIQVIEDVSYDYFLETFLATATGVQLDRLGKIVGCARGELGDTAYRAMIAIQVLVNQSPLSFPDISEILHRWADVQGLAGSLMVSEDYPAHIDVFADTNIYNDPGFATVCALIKPAGVSLVIWGGSGAYLLKCTATFEEASDYNHIAVTFSSDYNDGGLLASTS